jgi:1,4-alpha-glucan branching enzyme
VGKNGQQHLPLATQLEVADQIEFLGFVPDSERDCLYRIADAAVFPSIYEPFGIVALEAMGLDCNVIASSVGGLAEVIQHDVNGLNVFPDNPLSIAWAVNELFADEAAAARRRQLAMEQVASVYNWNTIARQTAEVYQMVVGERLETNW